ncbi:hypothetical protein [Paenibacillus tianjinensis]|uniref:Uncharacterized protein n=1 Tax=Paenibacillus tianjinensis TaxID=2810347 RepID=A0ABX7L777_9BACL|nr:hypothetical protein [Paenibacillus tianjinensis]QSF43959.1 hypothetical protein JRJ22_22375 [Paenibacillus tianjinensis]
MRGNDDQRTLYRTLHEEEAEYVQILSIVRGCRVTAGKMYKLYRNYNNPHIFEQGEMYVVDDDSKDNYAVLMLCATILYR